MQDKDALLNLEFAPDLGWGFGLFGLLMIVLIVFVTILVYRKKISTGTESMIGEKATIIQWSGTKGMVRIQGELWKAESDQNLELEENEEVLVTAVNNLLLKIHTV